MLRIAPTSLVLWILVNCKDYTRKAKPFLILPLFFCVRVSSLRKAGRAYTLLPSCKCGVRAEMEAFQGQLFLR